MALFEYTTDALAPLKATSFAMEGIRERDDLQRLLRARPEVVDADVLIVAEEFGEFEDANRRIDLLGVDRSGRLVVMELKRTHDGGHMELQALRYAAMVRTMTMKRLVEVFDKYLSNVNDSGDQTARERLDEWLDDPEAGLATEVRILLVSQDFGREITGTVLWLRDYGLDIRCVRVVPYRLDDRVLLDVQQVIPLPEAADYQVQLRQKVEATKAATSGADWTPYTVTDAAGTVHGPMRKRQAVLRMAQVVVEAGIGPERLVGVLPKSRLRFLADEDGGSDATTILARHPDVGPRRWFVEAPFVVEDGIYVLSKMWGLNTEDALEGMASLLPDRSVTFARLEDESEGS